MIMNDQHHGDRRDATKRNHAKNTFTNTKHDVLQALASVAVKYEVWGASASNFDSNLTTFNKFAETHYFVLV